MFLRGVKKDLHTLGNGFISPAEIVSLGPGFKARIPYHGILGRLPSWQSHRGNTLVPHSACIGRSSRSQKLRDKRIEVSEL